MSSHIRILILGDENVGKTTLLNSFIHGYTNDIITKNSLHSSNLLKREMNQIAITIGSSKGNNIPIVFCDFTGNKSTFHSLLHHIPIFSYFHAVIFVYDINNITTYYNIENYWIPLVKNAIRNLKQWSCSILVANKVDMLEKGNFQVLQNNDITIQESL